MPSARLSASNYSICPGARLWHRPGRLQTRVAGLSDDRNLAFESLEGAPRNVGAHRRKHDVNRHQRLREKASVRIRRFVYDFIIVIQARVDRHRPCERCQESSTQSNTGGLVWSGVDNCGRSPTYGRRSVP